MPLDREACLGAVAARDRRFESATSQSVAAWSPTQLPDSHRRDPQAMPAAGTIRVRLPYRAPIEFEQLLGHLVATAVPGVERWADGAYWRSLRLPNGFGVIGLRPAPGHVLGEFRLTDLRDQQAATARTRRLLDLDADPVAVDQHLSADPRLAPIIASAPGRRIPRTVDGVEFALRAVLGQQVSTASARGSTAKLVARYGEQLPRPDAGLTHLFPAAAALAEADPTSLPLNRSRAETLVRLARLLAEQTIDLGPGADRAEVRAQLASVRGIGPWTIELIAMRCLADPDAFPATDLGVIRGAAALGLPAGARLRAAAEAWRPWRSYAVQYLWAATNHSINRLPGKEQS